MHNQIPLARGLGSSAAATVGGVLAGQRARRRAAVDRRRCCASRATSRAIRTTPRPRCSAGSSCRPRPTDGVEAIRFDAPRDLRAVLFIPELRLPTDDDARGPAGVGARWPTRSPTSGPSAVGVAGLATGPLRPAGAADRRPAARAVPGGGLPAAAADGRGGARGRRARAPACRAPARRSSPSPTRWPGSPGSRPRSSRPRPTSTCPAGSRSSRRATPAHGSSSRPDGGAELDGRRQAARGPRRG